jgi:hypothetical protein
MQTSEAQSIALDVKTRAQKYWLLFQRFTQRYAPAILILTVSALIGWTTANSVSDYTKGGWEIHFIQSGIGLDLHFHHWYYGVPLGIIAFLIIEWNANVSIFLFGLGQALAAHSFINEGGIPSLLENGETLRVPPEIYFPIVTACALLYALFIIRREEWLFRAREREEIAASYLYLNSQRAALLKQLEEWAGKHLKDRRFRLDRDADNEYGSWSVLARDRKSEWQLHYVTSRFDDHLRLLVVRIEHVPRQGRAGELDDWMREIDATLKPLAQPAVVGPQVAMKAITQAQMSNEPIGK